MPRPSQIDEQRLKLLPVVAETFAALGYRRATTAELARRCEVGENILYRMWPDKRAMFVAAIDYCYENSVTRWAALANQSGDGRSAAMRLLEHESESRSDVAMYRIIFAGLSETDDPTIRAALRKMYERFHGFIRRQIADHRKTHGAGELPDTVVSAWAIIGLGTVADIGHELGLMTPRRRRRLLADAGRTLLGKESS